MLLLESNYVKKNVFSLHSYFKVLQEVRETKNWEQRTIMLMKSLLKSQQTIIVVNMSFA